VTLAACRPVACRWNALGAPLFRQRRAQVVVGLGGGWITLQRLPVMTDGFVQTACGRFASIRTWEWRERGRQRCPAMLMVTSSPASHSGQCGSVLQFTAPDLSPRACSLMSSQIWAAAKSLPRRACA
jgi:hypothetical protein